MTAMRTGSAYIGTGAQAGRGAAKVKALLSVMVAIIVIGVILFAMRMNMIARRADRIDTLNRQIAAERSHCQQLEIALNERRNIDMIRDEAKNRLGMFDPGETQTRVVALPGGETDAEIVTVYDAGE